MEEKRKWDCCRPIASTGKNMYNGKKPQKESAACFAAATAFVENPLGDEESNQALATLIGRSDMKQEFLKYIGSEDGLAGYARSYKLVLYKVFFSLMDGNGMAPGYRVAEAFREFYVDRVRRGLKADIRVDSRIGNINESSVQAKEISFPTYFSTDAETLWTLLRKPDTSSTRCKAQLLISDTAAESKAHCPR